MHGVRALAAQRRLEDRRTHCGQRQNNQKGEASMRRMKRLAAAIFLLGSCLATGPASADTYPSRPIRLLHGFAAGGAADTLSRIIADGLSKKLGQPIIVEAKPGAGGNIAADAVP